MTSTGQASLMQSRPSAVYTTTALFSLLGMIFIPFPFHLFPFQQDITNAVFGNLTGFISAAFFGVQMKSTLVHSDSRAMYILVLLLLLLSIVSGICMHYFVKDAKHRSRLLQGIRLLAVYYLILMLMKYGLDKVFKHQFYLPEPNILYTPLGQVDKDLLYWSSMGTSRMYTVFTGSIEVLAAILLLFRRTRMTGAFLAMAILTQVLLINLGFDISVKLYSAFLLLLSLFILYPYAERLLLFFSGRQVIPPLRAAPPVITGHPFLLVFSKCLLTGFILFESFFPYLRTLNFNDDAAARPPMHGAYAVKQFISGNDTLTGNGSPVKRFFIHRSGYLIFQDQQDAMLDYKLDFNPDVNNYTITDYQQHTITLDIDFRPADSLLTIQYLKNNVPVIITGKGLNWRQLPALQKTFHWIVE